MLQRLTRAAALEDAVLVPVASDTGRRLVEDLDHEARALLGHDLGESTAGTSEIAVAVMFLLLATESDDELAWLRSGEALERILLELADRGWAASVVPRVTDVPLVRAKARAELCWDHHPQALIRVG